MDYDYQMHTTYSDGEDSLEEMVSAAQDLGLQSIAVTDHVRKNSDWFTDYVSKIKALQKIYPDMDIKIGFEAKALNTMGELDATEEMISTSTMRLGAMHRIPNSETPGDIMSNDEAMLDKQRSYGLWLKTMKNLIQNPHVDAIPHPMRLIFRCELELRESDLHDLFELCKKYSTKMELTAKMPETNEPILKHLTKHPGHKSVMQFGSDAHSTEHLKKAHEEIINQLKIFLS